MESDSQIILDMINDRDYEFLEGLNRIQIVDLVNSVLALNEFNAHEFILYVAKSYGLFIERLPSSLLKFVSEDYGSMGDVEFFNATLKAVRGVLDVYEFETLRVFYDKYSSLKKKERAYVVAKMKDGDTGFQNDLEAACRGLQINETAYLSSLYFQDVERVLNELLTTESDSEYESRLQELRSMRGLMSEYPDVYKRLRKINRDTPPEKIEELLLIIQAEF
jgi:hypothetical protein